mgnify:CR=1 FL=1
MARSEAATRHAAYAARFADVAAGVRDWAAPTPLKEWTARDVVAHLTSWFPGFLAAYADVSDDEAKDKDTRLPAVAEGEVVVPTELVAEPHRTNPPARYTEATLTKTLEEMGFPKAEAYTGVEDWKKVCERSDVDLVYVCTHWDLHAPIGVYAMEQGKHVALEVPAALTIEECWQLVNTAEKTRRHCIQLENCNYDFFEMATHQMARQGLFGEIVHAEGAYIHDLRFLNFDDTTGYWNMWRLEHNALENGNLYPTHGLGPIAHILDIHRGDRMEYLVSVSSGQFGMSAYARDKFGEDSDYAQREYLNGDMNTSVIKTAKGRTIMLQHDVTSPRPYSRIHMISGTKGFAQKYPVPGIALEPDAHRFLAPDKLDSLLRLYEHPIVREVGQKAREVGGHGGMDFIMDYRPVAIPDFTRGAWNRLQRVTYYP